MKHHAAEQPPTLLLHCNISSATAPSTVLRSTTCCRAAARLVAVRQYVLQCSLQAAITPNARIVALADVEAIQLEGPAGLVLWCSAHIRRPSHMHVLLRALTFRLSNQMGWQGWCCGAVLTSGGDNITCTYCGRVGVVVQCSLQAATISLDVCAHHVP
jgi:hypothetical protein